MRVHLMDTHLMLPRSRLSAKFKVKYEGHIFQKLATSWSLVFHKHSLSPTLFENYNDKSFLIAIFPQFYHFLVASLNFTRNNRLEHITPSLMGRKPKHFITDVTLQVFIKNTMYKKAFENLMEKWESFYTC